MTAAEIGARSGIPEHVIVEKFGLRDKHIAAADEHVSDLSVEAAEELLAEAGVDPADDRRRHVLRLDVEGLGRVAGRALDRAPPRLPQRVRGRVRQRLARHVDRAAARPRHAPRRGGDAHVLVVAACRESYLLDYGNERSRFMFNFGDGAVAGLLVAGERRNEVLGAHAITDGSFSLQVGSPAAAVDRPAAIAFLDVADPAAMKERPRPVSLPNFVAAARGSARALGRDARRRRVPLPAAHEALDVRRAARTSSGSRGARRVPRRHRPHERRRPVVRPRPRRARRASLPTGDLVLLLSAGTGYTWAATVVRWGPAAEAESSS